MPSGGAPRTAPSAARIASWPSFGTSRARARGAASSSTRGRRSARGRRCGTSRAPRLASSLREASRPASKRASACATCEKPLSRGVRQPPSRSPPAHLLAPRPAGDAGPQQVGHQAPRRGARQDAEPHRHKDAFCRAALLPRPVRRAAPACLPRPPALAPLDDLCGARTCAGRGRRGHGRCALPTAVSLPALRMYVEEGQNSCRTFRRSERWRTGGARMICTALDLRLYYIKIRVLAYCTHRKRGDSPQPEAQPRDREPPTPSPPPRDQLSVGARATHNRVTRPARAD